MRAPWLAGLLVVSCATSGVAPSVPAPPTPIAVYVTPSPAPTFDPHSIAVSLLYEDSADSAAAAAIGSAAAALWSAATGGRSALHLAEGTPDVVVLLAAASPGQTSSRGDIYGGTVVRGGLRFIYLWRGAEPRMLVHELGHALGCCSGTGTDGQHLLCPEPHRGPIMCADGGDAIAFTDGELRAMGL